jgi:GxxExxY protein
MTRINLVEGTDEYWIAGLAMKVQRQLGFSMLESVYERALMIEFEKAGIPAERQVSIPVYYDGDKLNHGYAADIIVDNRILLELKAVTRLYAIHRRQIQFYLDASGIDSGLLINFGRAKGLECEWFRMQNSGYYPGNGLPIPEGELMPSAELPAENAASGSFEERVSMILGGDA